MIHASKNLHLKCDERPALPIQLPLIEIGHRLRVWRALKALAICWGLAIAAVFIPVLHFVLVPALVLLGIFFALNGYVDKYTLGEVSVQCVKCGADLKLPDYKDQFPKWFTCDLCKAEMQLVDA